MEWTQDQLAAVVGAQQLEIIGLRIQLAEALRKVQELTPKPPSEHPTPLEVVK